MKTKHVFGSHTHTFKWVSHYQNISIANGFIMYEQVMVLTGIRASGRQRLPSLCRTEFLMRKHKYIILQPWLESRSQFVFNNLHVTGETRQSVSDSCCEQQSLVSQMWAALEEIGAAAQRSPNEEENDVKISKYVFNVQTQFVYL